MCLLLPLEFFLRWLFTPIRGRRLIPGACKNAQLPTLQAVAMATGINSVSHVLYTAYIYAWGDADSQTSSGSEGGGGQVTYTNKAAGQYTVNWSNCKDFTAGKGWRNATGR
jgi:hypothetical protein